MDCLVLQYCEIDRGAEKLLRFQYLLFRVNYRGLGGGGLVNNLFIKFCLVFSPGLQYVKLQFQKLYDRAVGEGKIKMM